MRDVRDVRDVRDDRDDRDDDDNEQTRAYHATNDNARTSTVRAVVQVRVCAVHTSLLFQKFEFSKNERPNQR